MDHDTTPDADPQMLRVAPQVSLLRRPATDRAHALTESIAATIQQHGARSRKIGPKGLPRLLDGTGLVLGGLLSRSPDRPFVRAQKDHGADFWKPPVTMGGKAFWEKIAPLLEAGLVTTAPSINVPNSFGGFTGLATRIAATPALWALAAEHGCTPETRSDDWPIDRSIVAKRAKVKASDLLQFWEWPHISKGQVRQRQNRARVPTPPHAVHLIAAVERLNEMAAGLTIEGCAPPQFKRVYGPNIFLGGRYYATGEGDGYQNIRRVERKRIRISGEPIAEVDIKAAALSIFLALHSDVEFPEDPYAGIGFHRDHVKAWATESIYPGKLKSRLSSDAIARLGSVPAKDIKSAMLARYPALANLGSIAPPEATELMTDGRLLPWASGQSLMAKEAQIINKALMDCMDAGLVALPLHDALVCPVSAAEGVADILRRVSRERLGPALRVEAKQQVTDGIGNMADIAA